MITVPEGTRRIVERSRYLSEALSKGIINHSSLARYIKPELEKMLIKKVSNGAVVMALKRLEKNLKPQSRIQNVFDHPPEMVIRSGLMLTTIQRTRETEDAISDLFLTRIKGSITSITIGATEITIAGNHLLMPQLNEKFEKAVFLTTHFSVSQITITIPPEAIITPGVYYFFLKSIAWEGINILGNAATSSEYTLFFEDSDVNRAFEILSSLFTKKVI